MTNNNTPPAGRGYSGLFWLLLTILVLGLAVYLFMDDSGGTLFGLHQSELRQASYLLVLLVFVGSALLGRRLRVGEIFRSILMWGAIFLIAITAYAYRDDLGAVGARVLAVLAPGVPIAGNLAGEMDESVVVMRQMDGHFFVRADVEGSTMTLMVDTGASYVALTVEDARRIGVDPDTLSYHLPIRTANGMIQAAPITINRMAIGSIERRNVQALVSPPGAMDESLLGLSFLNSLRSYAISGDRLVLTP